MNELWQKHFDHDVEFHRKTATIYDHVNTEPRVLANDLLFAPLDRRVAPGESMLDLGCGTRQMLLRMRRASGAQSHEAPIGDGVLLRLPERFGFRRVIASRAWEMFQRHLPASALDHMAMRYLHARYGRTGNVVAVLWQAI